MRTTNAEWRVKDREGDVVPAGYGMRNVPFMPKNRDAAIKLAVDTLCGGMRGTTLEVERQVVGVGGRGTGWLLWRRYSIDNEGNIRGGAGPLLRSRPRAASPPVNPLDMGAILLAALARAGVSPAEVSRRCGMAPSNVSRALHSPDTRPATARRILDCVGATVGLLPLPASPAEGTDRCPK